MCSAADDPTQHDAMSIECAYDALGVMNDADRAALAATPEPTP